MRVFDVATRTITDRIVVPDVFVSPQSRAIGKGVGADIGIVEVGYRQGTNSIGHPSKANQDAIVWRSRARQTTHEVMCRRLLLGMFYLF